MAAPVKALIAPTSLSNINVTNIFKRPNYAISNLKSISQKTGFVITEPVFYNQLGLKFSFISPAIVDTTNIFKRPNYAISNLKNISQNGMNMLTNTFPAVYTPAVLRPTVGQLYPLSGTTPY